MDGETIQILHIEDNPMEAMLMRELVSVSLPEEHALLPAGTLAQATQLLQRQTPDLILLDLSLPDTSGIDTIRALTPHAPGVPIIVLSGYDDEKTSIEALRAGAQDYLVKGEVSSHLLRHAIRYSVERKRLDAALALERDLVDTLLEHVPDRVYFKDITGRFLRISRSMADLFSLSHPAEAQGRTDDDFFSTEYASASRDMEQSIVESGQPVVGQIEQETLRDGSACWILATRMPLQTSSGETVGTFGISRDISQFKEAEESLESALNRNRRLASDLRRLASLTAEEIRSAVGDLETPKSPGVERLERAAERLHGISRLDRNTESLGRVDLRTAIETAQAQLADSDRIHPKVLFKPENFPPAMGNTPLLTQLLVELLRGLHEMHSGALLEVRANESDRYLETMIGPSGQIGKGTSFSVAQAEDSALGGLLAFTLCREIVSLHGGELLTAPGGIVRFTLPRGRN